MCVGWRLYIFTSLYMFFLSTVSYYNKLNKSKNHPIVASYFCLLLSISEMESCFYLMVRRPKPDQPDRLLTTALLGKYEEHNCKASLYYLITMHAPYKRINLNDFRMQGAGSIGPFILSYSSRRDTASYLISDECCNSVSNYDRYCLGPNGARCSAVARLDPRVHIIGKTCHACMHVEVFT